MPFVRIAPMTKSVIFSGGTDDEMEYFVYALCWKIGDICCRWH